MLSWDCMYYCLSHCDFPGEPSGANWAMVTGDAGVIWDGYKQIYNGCRFKS